MAEFHPSPGMYDVVLSREEERGSKQAIDYLRARAGEQLEPDELVDLAASVANIALAQQLGLLPLDIQKELNSAADSIYNLPKT